MDDNIKIPSSDEYKIGLCGFNNIGNTCYMNSILQLLIHSSLIINFLQSKSNPFIGNIKNKTFVELILDGNIDATFIEFLKTNILDELEEKERKKFGLPNNTEVNIYKNDYKKYLEKSLTVKLSEIINTIIYKGYCTINPISFKNVIDIKIPTLRGFGQQDAHELLNYLLDNIIEETGINSEPKINNVPNTIIEYNNLLHNIKQQIQETKINDERKKIINSLNEYKKKNIDVINKYNGLKYMTHVYEDKRQNSLNTSTTGYNPLLFNLLTFNVNIFKCTICNDEINKYEYNTILCLQVKPTLKECFESYVNEEKLDRICNICKNNTSTSKKIIWRPGILLFLQLGRFKNMPDGRICKNNSYVEIPHQIDISEFCDNSMKTEKSKSLSYKYCLKGISNHIGSLNGGHYTSDCVSIMDEKTWYHFDDSRVGKYSGINIDTSNAYILMYEMMFDE